MKYEYFSIGFTDAMVKDKSMTHVTNLFLPNNFEKNDEINLNYFGSKI